LTEPRVIANLVRVLVPVSARDARGKPTVRALEEPTAPTREILRQASVALGGRPVTLWEAVAPARLEPRASTEPDGPHRSPGVDLYSTIERWRIPLKPGTGWLGGRAWTDGPWVVAPVRFRPPAPPPDGRERRSRERMTLELAALCLGLGQKLEAPDALAEPAGVPAAMLHEASNPLAAAKGSLQLAIEAIGKWSEPAAAQRLEMLEELGLVVDDIDRAAQLLRSIHDRTRRANSV
jgi:signal transduction histidine kinase